MRIRDFFSFSLVDVIFVSLIGAVLFLIFLSKDDQYYPDQFPPGTQIMETDQYQEQEVLEKADGTRYQYQEVHVQQRRIVVPDKRRNLHFAGPSNDD